MREANYNEKLSIARKVATHLREQLNELDEQIAKGTDKLRIEQLSDRIAESAARLHDEMDPVRRGKSRVHHVRKALGYTYP